MRSYWRSLKATLADGRLWVRKVVRVRRRHKVPLWTRMRMNLKGFTSDQYIMFDLERNNPDEYITEFERWKTRDVNGRYRLVLDDKLLFEQVFRPHVHVPKSHAWIRQGRIHDLQGRILGEEEVLALLRKEQQLILKPVIRAGGGKGVSLLSYQQGQIHQDGAPLDAMAFQSIVKRSDDYILTEVLNQHAYAKEIFPDAVNTIRLVSVYDDAEGKVILTNAVHRIGVPASAPVDNASRGALVATVDLDSGILGKARSYWDSTLLSFHPSTGKPIEGVAVPGWEALKEEVRRVASLFPYIPFISWDLVVTPTGYAIVEINASTDMSLLQLENGIRQGLLGDYLGRKGYLRK